MELGPSLTSLDRLALFGTLEQLLAVGIPLTRALRGLREQSPAGGARDVVDGLLLHVTRGLALAEAMRAFPRAFSRMQVGVVAAAERGGSLSSALGRLARHESRALSLSRHVRSVMVYPLVVFVAAVGLIVFLAQLLLSGVAPVLAQARIETGLVTSLFLGLAGAMRDVRVLGLLLLALVGGAAATRRWLSRDEIAGGLERLVLSIPVVGPLVRRVETVHVCESLATLHDCGVPLAQSLEAAASCCAHEASRRALAVVGREVRRGRTLSDAFTASGFFGRSVTQMVAVGEQSGTLPRMLGRVAEYQELEVRSALEQFAAALEPVMIGALGLIVAVIILAAFAPLYRLVATLA